MFSKVHREEMARGYPYSSLSLPPFLSYGYCAVWGDQVGLHQITLLTFTSLKRGDEDSSQVNELVLADPFRSQKIVVKK